ncbi:MAG: transcription antitermination factor NusB [Alphaproteobacteria bacterium]
MPMPPQRGLPLRWGSPGLLMLGTKPHAAVNSTVTLVRLAGHPRLAGLANAVLRRIAREGEAARGQPWMRRVSTRRIGCGRAGAALARGAMARCSRRPMPPNRRSTLA